ncbi:hypothetical protein BDV93DRAFT_36642 [Ceratobasidium sp. AG-I]|nr:hypothetical protein BDV93DRAFT_36642 [Ceratobasidium sp. AG-I]
MRRTEHPFAAAHTAIIPKPKTEKPIALDSDLSGDSGTDSGQPDRIHFLSDGWGMKRQRAVVPNPFPPTAVALEWECIKDLGETEINLGEVEELFNERREQVRQDIADWRAGFERRLVEIHEAGAEGTASGAAVGVPNDGWTEVELIVK